MLLKKGSYLRDSEIDKLIEVVSPRDLALEILRYEAMEVPEDKAKRIAKISATAQLSADR